MRILADYWDKSARKSKGNTPLIDDSSLSLIPVSIEPSSIGQAANQVARQSVLQDYQARKSQQTLRRQKADIALFEQFLQSAGHRVEGLVYDLASWDFVTW